MRLQVPPLLRYGIQDFCDAMSHLIPNKDPDKYNGKQYPQEWEDKIKQIYLRNFTLAGNKLKGEMNRIFEYHSCHSAGNTCNETEQIHLLLMAQLFCHPADQAGKMELYSHYIEYLR